MRKNVDGADRTRGRLVRIGRLLDNLRDDQHFLEPVQPSPDEGDAALSEPDPDPDPLDSPADAGDVSLLAEDALLAPVFLLSVL